MFLLESKWIEEGGVGSHYMGWFGWEEEEGKEQK